MLNFQNALDRFFNISENQSTVGTEVRAGLVTFLTASYIIFVQPAIMVQAGMDFGAVMTATCIASAIGCLIMGLWANYPIALALGFIAYPIIKLLCGKARQVHWCMYVIALLFVLRYWTL